ncbi:hypothetical protein [Streptomyces pini]|uniref:Uncharacterized protein n=1 Tax=Streptomyces pini TaxID=1520580 RepID=A0A1I4C1K9_9ACTN|nr:hypothetical protein [Streptomyces pini]SFK74297.1 hypothetical protein SAMN05192584_108202 [Streptomyces pini]
MTPLAVAIGAALFLTGYAAGRTRPLSRLDDWAWEQVYQAGRTGRRGVWWWAAQVVFAVECAVILAVRPRRTLRQWREVRERRRSGPRRAAAPQFDPDWAAKRAANR